METVKFVVFDSKINLYSSGLLHQRFTCSNIEHAHVFSVERTGSRSNEHYIRSYLRKEGVRAAFVRIVTVKNGKKTYGELEVI